MLSSLRIGSSRASTLVRNQYESLPGSTPILDVNPMTTEWIRGRSELWITEGPIKGDALVSVGLPAIALLGVSSWQVGGLALEGWRDVRLRGRDVVIAFDSDVMTKASVARQLDALGQYLRGHGATVRHCLLPVTL